MMRKFLLDPTILLLGGVLVIETINIYKLKQILKDAQLTQEQKEYVEFVEIVTNQDW